MIDLDDENSTEYFDFYVPNVATAKAKAQATDSFDISAVNNALKEYWEKQGI